MKEIKQLSFLIIKVVELIEFLRMKVVKSSEGATCRLLNEIILKNFCAVFFTESKDEIELNR